MSPPHSRHARFSYAVLFLLLWPAAHGAQVNVTLDDADPSIAYAPPGSWNSSAVVCAAAACEDPPVLLALGQTYHKGVYVIATNANDTVPTTAPPTPTPSPEPTTSSKPTSSSVPSPSPQPTPSPKPAPAPPPDDDPNTPPGTPDDDHDADDTSNKKSKSKPGRRGADRLPRLDVDVDTPVFAQVNFSGTAVYVYAIQSLLLSVPPAPPSLMNITILLDGVAAGSFVHQAAASSSSVSTVNVSSTFAPNINIFAAQGLPDGPHALSLRLAPNSALVLDYVLVTKNVDVVQTPSAAAAQLSSPSATSADTATKDNPTSFAGALAGSLGVLGIICFGTAGSLVWRRRRAARRERGALLREPRPPMSTAQAGGAFVPRYFPGTVVPPAYAPSSASSSSHGGSEPLLHQADGEDSERSYADIPPPLEDLAPPPFGVALTSPAVRIVPMRSVSGQSGVQIVQAVPSSRPPSWAADMVPLPPSRAGSIFTSSDRHDEGDDGDHHVLVFTTEEFGIPKPIFQEFVPADLDCRTAAASSALPPAKGRFGPRHIYAKTSSLRVSMKYRDGNSSHAPELG
ncbi:hypothetical protein FB451DRAFT_1537942 [Mycena latifolia]|nr:hypothetical protein FB451DRAFT_1537942 [Mycena latifolia]